MNQSFLGRGWSFPPVFDKQSKGVAMLEGETDIHSSLDILLSTMLGERVMLPGYGCDMKDLLFEAMNATLNTLMVDRIKTALLLYEPRIEVENIQLVTDRSLEGIVLIQIDYKVRSTNSRLNYVYPFYRNEGTELDAKRIANETPATI
jgi:phage baseplate assembly protein W